MDGVTRAIVETPPGRGAVAVVVVDGPGSLSAVDASFQAANGKPLAEQPMGAIRFGRWGPDDGEELVVCRTSDATVEVHCHGGHAAVRAVVAALVASGCVETPWRDSIGDSIEAEARRALADCTTDRAAAVLLDQLAGALTSAIESAIVAIREGADAEAMTTIDQLLARSACGVHLTRPWSVTIAGAPNVGKSSLINALVGYERAIVFDQPGVTRDVVTAAAAIDGWPVELADTAGLRDSEDAIELAGVGLARRVARESDLIVLVEAVGYSPAPGERPLEEVVADLGLDASGAILRVANKVDLAGGPFDRSTVDVAVSATTGMGIDELVRAIGQRLAPSPPTEGEAVPFTGRHARHLSAARAALASDDGAAASAELLALLAPGRGAS